jgi:lysyl-tRNA synthetase class 2
MIGLKDGLTVSAAHFLSGEISAEEVLAQGRIVSSNRSSKEIHYYFLNNESGGLRMRHSIDGLELPPEVKNGDLVEVKGRVYNGKNGLPYLDITELSVIERSGKLLPNTGYFNNPANRANTHESIMMNSDTLDLFKKRSKALAILRNVMSEEGYLEVSTPTLLSKSYSSKSNEFSAKWLAKDREVYLRKALEPKLKLLIIGGLEKIYEVGPVYRNEGLSKGYLPEFLEMDIFKAYSNYYDMMDLSETLFAHVSPIFGINSPVKRFSFEGVMEEVGHSFKNPTERFVEFRRQVLPKLASPTLIYDFPLEVCPLAKSSDKIYSEEFRLYLNGVDIFHGYTVETDYDTISKLEEGQMASRDKDQKRYDSSFREALLYGMPPTGGLGLGIDRMIQNLSGKADIRDVVMFPLV